MYVYACCVRVCMYLYSMFYYWTGLATCTENNCFVKYKMSV